ncbi:MAG TPA: hypothetical protein VEN81_11945, partial [Planctomycetota bacterium]|nr:hypothetical protein [Planctomycetota bacterium]
EIRMSVQEEAGRPKHLSASAEFTPPLQAKVGWEEIDSNGRARRLESPEIPLPAGGFGEYRLRPVVDLEGLAPLRPRKEATYTYSSLSIGPVPEGRVRSGPPVPLAALPSPPLREGTEYQWTRSGGGQPIETVVSNRPTAVVPFPAAGRYRLQVRAGGNVSPPVDLVAVRISLAGPEGRSLSEARLALLQKNAVPTDEWLAACPERFRVVVEDPSAEAPGSLSVFIREGDEGELGAPVIYSLSGTGEKRETRLLALVGDRSDDAVPLGGTANGQPGDPTLYARPRSRIMVRYRGESAAVADVGPMIVHEIPVRFVAAGPGLPEAAELEKILKRRLEEASDVWAPYGRRFVLSSLQMASEPRNLLLVRGRRAGVDAHGRASRAGVKVDQAEVSVPTPWSQEAGGTTPGATARSFVSKLDASYTAEVFEGLIPSDREAVVLRVRRRDGRPVELSALADGQDVAQSFALLAGDLAGGCEVTTDPKLLTLEELMLLLGLRVGPPEGIDLFVVKALRSDALEPARYKIYPDEVFPAPLSGAAVVAWEVADGSGRYPYALARVVGELLLPPGWRPRPEDSLFSGELSIQSSPDANKRVGPTTGTRIRERGRGQSLKNDDITRGNLQGGK